MRKEKKNPTKVTPPQLKDMKPRKDAKGGGPTLLLPAIQKVREAG
jgi:hypothetical protein